MNVTPDNSRGRFWVESRSEPGHSHLVDLTAHNGKGECGCDQWKYRCQPAIKEGKTAWCAHIEECREFISDLSGDGRTYLDRQIIVNKVIKLWIQEESGSSAPE